MWQWLKSRLLGVWEGPPNLTRSLRLEWRFVVIRWLGIACAAPGLLLADLPRATVLAGGGILLFAVLYNGAVQVMLRRRPGRIANGVLTTVGDAVLNVVFLTIAGFNSPFYYIVYTVTIAAVLRYGYAIGISQSLLFVTVDYAESVVGGAPVGAAFVIRSGFLVLTALLAGYLREQTELAETALQERLRAANRLNAATGMLAASLELNAVLKAIVAAASQLFESQFVLLQPTTALQENLPGLAPVARSSGEAPPAWWEHLVAACNQACARQSNGGAEAPSIYRDFLPTGQLVLLLVLERPSLQIPLAALGIVLPTEKGAAPPAEDIVRSFRERVTLAIENASLYRTLATRSVDLQTAYADLEVAHEELLRVAEMKTNFLANVSHEFRTPLSSIRSFSELLLTYDDPTVQRDFLEIINQESERLTRMVNDVLDITRIESGNMSWDMQPIDVERLLRDTARSYLPLIARHNLTFIDDISPALPAVYGDWDRLSQVIGNLLDNAVKFTNRGQVLLCSQQIGDEVYITVSDTGMGVSPKDQERIFDKFQQVGEVLTDKPRGAGLGLSICREIVEHHQGRIWVESEPGRGSTFTIALRAVAQAPTNKAEFQTSPFLVPSGPGTAAPRARSA